MKAVIDAELSVSIGCAMTRPPRSTGTGILAVPRPREAEPPRPRWFGLRGLPPMKASSASTTRGRGPTGLLGVEDDGDGEEPLLQGNLGFLDGVGEHVEGGVAGVAVPAPGAEAVGLAGDVRGATVRAGGEVAPAHPLEVLETGSWSGSWKMVMMFMPSASDTQRWGALFVKQLPEERMRHCSARHGRGNLGKGVSHPGLWTGPPQKASRSGSRRRCYSRLQTNSWGGKWRHGRVRS